MGDATAGYYHLSADNTEFKGLCCPWLIIEQFNTIWDAESDTVAYIYLR